MPDISAEKVAKALVTARELFNLLGTKHLRRTPYLPQDNRIMEQWHQVFKAPILAAGKDSWTDYLTLILLNLRTAYKLVTYVTL